MTTLPYPRVVVWRGGQVVGEHALPAGAELVVGRSEGCGIVVGDGSVSRMHARLVSDEQGVYLEDLGSANGTYVDGARVQGRVRLEHGQQVRVAQKAQTSPVVLRFEDPRTPLVGHDDDDAVDVGAATVAMRTYDPRREPPVDATTAPAEWPDETVPAVGAELLTAPSVAPRPAGPPSLPPPAARRAPLASTTPLRDEPAAARASARTGRSRRRLVLALVGIAALGALAVAAAAGWWLLRWQASRRAAAPAAGDRTSATPAPMLPVASAPPVVPAALPLAATPAEATPTPGADATAAPMPPAALGGKWTARLENLFYPEGDYVVTVRLDLQQRGNALSGRGQASIESRSMTFGVPPADASGTVRPGAPPRVRLRLPFSRPIGELELEGTFENGALAGTYRSSLINQPGTWQAVRDAG